MEASRKALNMLLIYHLVAAMAPLSRRAVTLGAATAAISAPVIPAAHAASGADTSYTVLQSRLEVPVVKSPGFSPSGSTLPALPEWVVGDWEATQTLVRFSTPLGVQYIGAPGRPLSEAEASAAQTREQIGKPIALNLRFSSYRGGAAEDRAFNAMSRYDAFAGKPVVREAASCEAGNAAADLLAGQPQACTVIDFKGPVQQKLLVNALRVGRSSDDAAFVASELTRGIFARKIAPGDTRNFQPITTDTETVIELSRGASPDELRGRLRLVSYLQPMDPLYFSAGGQSVSISDYSLSLVRRR